MRQFREGKVSRRAPACNPGAARCRGPQ